MITEDFISQAQRQEEYTRRLLLDLLIRTIKDYVYEPEDDCAIAENCADCSLYLRETKEESFNRKRDQLTDENGAKLSAAICKNYFRTAEHLLFKKGIVYYGLVPLQYKDICTFLDIDPQKLKKAIHLKPQIIIRFLRKLRNKGE